MRLLIALLILHLSLATCAIAEPVQIGVAAPLTGSAAASGETVRNSILLADSLYNKDKIVSFQFEDDQLQPKNTLTAVQKLLDVDKIGGLIVFGSGTSLAVVDLVERREIPMIALSIVDRVVNGRKFIVKHWVTSRTENERIVSEVKKRGYRKVAIVATTNDAMLALKDHFTESKVSEIVLSEDVAREETDLRTIVTRIVALKPDAVYNLLWAPQPGNFTKQLRAAGYQGAIFGVHNLEDPNEVALAQGALNGAWLVTGDDSAGEEFYKKYKTQYGKSPAAGGLNAFDAARLMIEGVKSGNLLSYLHSVKNFDGAYGTYGASGQNDFTIGATVKVIDGESFKRE